MTTLISFILALCSLGSSLLTVAAFYVGMDTATLGLLGCISVVSFGYAVAITKF